MKVGVSYKQEKVTGQYDVIIIGSGMGGLATAAILAKEGKKVLILEKHYTAGGFTHSFKRNDYEWDIGIHYIGAVDNSRRTIRRLFDYITDSQLQWADMGEEYDRIIFGNKIYRFVKGLHNWVKQMKEYFPAPDDQQAIDKYVELILKANKASKLYYAEKAFSGLPHKLLGGFMQSGYMKYAGRTTLEVLKEITQNEELIGVLTGQFGDYGLTPSKSSFAIHALVVSHYFDGGYYPVGGAGRIAETVAPVIEAAGGKIYISAAVDEIVIENGKATGVKMADGKIISAPVIISNAGFINTFSKLIPKAVADQTGYLNHLKKVTPSAAHISLYIGLKHTAAELNLPKTNYWIYPDKYNHDENMDNYIRDPEHHPLPLTYISFPAAKDPDFENKYPGRSTIEIIGFAPYQWFAQWEGTRWNKRGEDYEALKEKLSQQLLQKLYQFVPQVKGEIDHYELSTPLSTANFVNYAHGEIYGLDHSPQRFGFDFLRPATPIKNFYLTGQDVVGCGIGGALFSAVVTSTAIMKKNMASKIMKQQKMHS
jgi:all-trans-retinol 13,14-reductase